MDLQTASKRSNGYRDHFEAVSGVAKRRQQGPLLLVTILRPLVDLQTASKRSNGYRDHFEAVSGIAKGVKEVQGKMVIETIFEAVSGFANGVKEVKWL